MASPLVELAQRPTTSAACSASGTPGRLTYQTQHHVRKGPVSVEPCNVVLCGLVLCACMCVHACCWYQLRCSLSNDYLDRDVGDVSLVVSWYFSVVTHGSLVSTALDFKQPVDENKERVRRCHFLFELTLQRTSLA